MKSDDLPAAIAAVKVFAAGDDGEALKRAIESMRPFGGEWLVVDGWRYRVVRGHGDVLALEAKIDED